MGLLGKLTGKSGKGRCDFDLIETTTRAAVKLPLLFRSPIPGGWLVMSDRGCVTFVSDPNYEWDGNSLKE